MPANSPINILSGPSGDFVRNDNATSPAYPGNGNGACYSAAQPLGWLIILLPAILRLFFKWLVSVPFLPQPA